MPLSPEAGSSGQRGAPDKQVLDSAPFPTHPYSHFIPLGLVFSQSLH